MWKRTTAFIVVSSAFVYSVIRYFSGGVCRCPSRLDGLVVIITGGNSGIGKALAIEVAKRGAEVIIACRDPNLGYTAVKEIITKSGNYNIHLKHLDLNSVSSIVKFSNQIQSQFPEVYALVNNAGVFYYPQEITEDGYDVTLQTNYLGPFILSHYLLKCLRNSEHARIVNLSSEAHRLVNEYDLRAILYDQKITRSNFIAYGVSKLALLLFTKELSKRLLILKKIAKWKRLLIGPLCEEEGITRVNRVKAWKKIHNYAKSFGLLPPNKEYVYTRGVFWVNLKRATIKKLELNVQRKKDRRRTLRLTEVDKVILNILEMVADTFEIKQEPTVNDNGSLSSTAKPDQLVEENTEEIHSDSSYSDISENDPNELQQRKLKLEVDLLEKFNYRASLEILKLERSLGVPMSEFTKDILSPRGKPFI